MTVLDKFSVKLRITMAFLFVSIVVTLFGMFTMQEMKTLGGLTSTLYEHPLRVSNAALKAQSGIIRMHRAMKDVVLSTDDVELQDAMAIVRQDERHVREQLDIVEHYILGEEGKLLAEQTREAFDNWRPIRVKVVNMMKAENSVEAARITKDEDAQYVRMLEHKMDDLTAYARAKADGFMANARDVQDDIAFNTISLLASLIFIMFLVVYVVVRHMLGRLGDLQTRVAEITETGEMKEVPVYGENEIAGLAESFNELIASLKRQFWLREGVNELNDKLSTMERMAHLSETALGFIARHVDASSGALFLYDEDRKVSELIASYAFVERKHLANAFPDGQGIVGQVARERRAILLSNITRDDAVLESGTVSQAAHSIMAMPLVYHDKLLGVVEVVSPGPLDIVARDFLEYSSLVIATAMSNAAQRERIDRLYNEAKEANSALEAKSDELAFANEQLGARNEELRAQSQELKAQSMELKEQADELTIQKNELEVKRLQVEEADRLKSEFLSNMSHELRTPLNSIMALSQLMMSRGTGTDPEKEKEFLLVIERNGRHLLSLINDILDLSKIEAGRMDIYPMTFNPAEVLSDVVSTLEPLVQEKGLELSVHLEYQGDVVTDREKTRQILLNLVSNAIKFTDEGDILINMARRNDEIVISVKDTGIGIAEEDQDNIFDEFRQVDGSTSRKHEGTGLGLAICKKLALLLGGDLFVESALGVGSTFVLVLPFESDVADVENAGAAEREWEHGGDVQSGISHQSALKERTILVVDDDHEVRELIKQYLAQAGYSVIGAENGQKALEIARTQELFAITLDIVMPEMDGWEVLRQLKLSNDTKDIPVIVISVSNDQTTGMALGATGYVVKPVDRARLLSELGRIGTFSDVRTILVVDDDELVRAQISKVLQGEGYTTVEAEGGRQGLEKVRLLRPDAVLLDLMMPEVDGFEVLRQMNEDSALADIPVLIVTAKDLNSEEREQILSRTKSIVQKGDMDLSRLLRQIERELRSIDPGSAKATDKSGVGATRQGKPRILVVEDNEIAALQITTALREVDLDVTHVEDGDEAVKFVAQTIPDVIVLDLMMPGVNGFDVLESIRSKPETATLPVVVLTAKELTSEDRARLTNNNVRQLIRKGALDREQLKRIVQRAVSDSSTPQRPKPSAGGSLASLSGTSSILPEKMREQDLPSLAEAGRNKTILVVEDNPDNILTVKAVLADFPGRLEFATDGESAVERAFDILPDLILMDIQLPGMSGLEATRVLKQDARMTMVPIIALTARIMKEEQEEVFAAGCDELVTKPFSPETLRKALRKWLGKQGTPQQ